MSWKEWDQGEVVEAGDLQEYIQDQVVQNYADSAARSTALGTAVAEGMVSYLQDSNSVEVYDGSAWVSVANDLSSGTAGYTALSNGTAGLSYQPVSHNYIINGAFDIWQRGTGFEPTTDTFTADRWEYRGNRTTASVDRVAFGVAEIEANGFGDAEAYLEIQVDASGTFFALSNLVEDVRTLANQTVTMSFWAKASSATTLSADLRQVFGSGGSSLVELTAQSYSVTTSWQRFSLTFSMPSISGKTIGSGSYLEVRPIRQVNATAYTIDIWGVQLEAGSIATPFKRNANSTQGELAACQRYYERIDAGDSATFLASGLVKDSDEALFTLFYKVQKRTISSDISFSGADEFRIYYAATNAVTDLMQRIAGTRSNSSVGIKAGVPSGLTSGQAAILSSNITGAYIEIEDEL